MTKFSARSENIFSHKIPPILKLEVGFLSDIKVFRRFSKIRQIFLVWTTYDEIFSKIRETFLITQSVSHSLITMGRGVVVRTRLECTRKSGLCLRHFFKLISTRNRELIIRWHRRLHAHGFSTERARLAEALRFARGFKCTRLQHRTCKTSRGHFASLVVPKKCLLPPRILIFFFKKKSRFWKLKLDFFPVKKSFSQIFQNTEIFFYLNFIKKKKKRRTFCGR